MCRNDDEDKRYKHLAHRHTQIREQLYSRKTYRSLLNEYTSKVRKA